MSQLIQKAFNLALKYHGDQKYGDKPYICHLMGVAAQLSRETDITVALLHDILEDTDVLYEEIEKTFGKNIAQICKILNKSHYNNYEDYIEEIATHPVATRVKIADLRFNLANNPKAKNVDKYEKALNKLLTTNFI